MSKKLRLYILLIALVLCVSIILSIIFVRTENKDFAAPWRPMISPSGKYELQIKEEYPDGFRFWRFQIALIEGSSKSKIVYSCDKVFRTRDALFMLWDQDNRVWVYSGDVGVFYWTQLPSGKWEEKAYDDKFVLPPDALVRVRPYILNN